VSLSSIASGGGSQPGTTFVIWANYQAARFEIRLFCSGLP
jgi:hypothetical protein